MTYSPTYTSSDLPAIFIDIIGTYWVQIVAFAGLIALLLIVGILMKSGIFTKWFGHK